MLSLLTSKPLTQAGFSHGFTTRLGGVSPDPYASLDFAVLRDAALLTENQARLATTVGFEPAALHQAMQVHGKKVIVANGDPKATLTIEADALVAEPNTGHAVLVRVADCVPILIADPKSGRVAAIHAGWRGIEAGVLGAAVRHLADAPNAGPVSSLLAAVGPCIGACCFEVGLDVGERIAKAAGPKSDVIDRTVGDKVYVDLRLAVQSQLRDLGLDDSLIDDVPSRGREGCTRCDAKRFYSFRRDGDASGRLAGVIVARSSSS